MKSLAAAVLGLTCAVGCAGSTSPIAPATLDTRHDACATCRMGVSSVKFAAQLVAPGEDPIFFDDIGCLARYLREHPILPPGAAAYVADHRTAVWVPAASAVYARVPTLDTPMASHIVAHANRESRDGDAEVRGSTALPVTQVFDRPAPDGRS